MGLARLAVASKQDKRCSLDGKRRKVNLVDSRKHLAYIGLTRQINMSEVNDITPIHKGYQGELHQCKRRAAHKYHSPPYGSAAL